MDDIRTGNSRRQNLLRQLRRADGLHKLRVAQHAKAKPDRKDGRWQQIQDAADRLRVVQSTYDALPA